LNIRKYDLNVPHLIVVFPLLFSFVRFKLAENYFEHLKNLPNKCRQLSCMTQANSIFGLPGRSSSTSRNFFSDS
jgi:hypothetical protein